MSIYATWLSHMQQQQITCCISFGADYYDIQNAKTFICFNFCLLEFRFEKEVGVSCWTTYKKVTFLLDENVTIHVIMCN